MTALRLARRGVRTRAIVARSCQQPVASQLRERHRYLRVEDQRVLGRGLLEGVPCDEVKDLRDEGEANAVVLLLLPAPWPGTIEQAIRLPDPATGQPASTLAPY